MTVGDMIEEYCAKYGMSYRQFAVKSGITNGYISMLIHNLNPKTGLPPRPKLETYVALAAAMGMTVDDLFRRIEDAPIDIALIPNAIPYTPARAMVPIVGSVRCGPGGLAYQDLQGSELADVPNPDEYFYLRAEGDSMAPDIKEGDLVLVHQQEDVESGELAVVIVDSEEGMLKKFIRKGNAVVLQSFNPEYPPRVLVGEELQALRIAGRVMEVKRKY